MHPVSRFLCGAVVCLIVGGISGAARAAGEPRFAPDEVLVRFKPRARASHAAEVHRASGATVKKAFAKVDRLQLVTLPPGSSVKEAARRYREDPDVLYAEPNYLVEALATPNDPSFSQLWALRNTGQDGGTAGVDIRAEQAWDSTTGNRNVVVAVIDTGVDYTHPDLAANIFSNPGDCTLDGVDDDGNGWADDCHGIDTVNNDADPMDDHDHGTHVAGTIGAVGDNGIGVVGVNWEVGIMACKFLGASGSGTTADAVACLDYVAAMKDRGVNIVATNNSWGGGGFSQALYDAIDAQRQRGILFIAAAGNSARDTDLDPSYPGGYGLPNLIAVAATDRDDARAWFSNYGRYTVHLGAPGSSILSTVPGAGYATFSGTSMAAPHVTGVAALLKAADPARDWLAIRRRLLAGGDVVPALAATMTGRRLSAVGALGCTDAEVTSRLEPRSSQAYGSLGSPLDLAVLHLSCATAASELAVTVDPPGPGVTLRDDGVEPDRFAGDGVYSGRWTPPGIGAYTLGFPGGDSVQVEVYDIGEAIDQPGLSFSTSGAAGWFGETAVSHDGVDAAASGRIGNGQSSSLAASVTLAASAYVSFWWRVSSESGWDFLEFSVDGIVQASISGEVPWQQRAFRLGSGTHTLAWTYRKDASDSSGSDTGWVDELSFPAAAPARTLTVQTGNPPDGVTVAASPIDLDGWRDGVAPFTRRYLVGTTATLTAPFLAGLNYFERWEGCSSVTGRTCTVTVDVDRSVIAVFGTGVALGDAVEQPEWAFTTEGAAGWYGQTAVSRDGFDSARSGAIGDSQDAVLETTHTFPASGYLSYWWKVSSEQGYDFLEFAIDGTVMASVSGEVDWARKLFPIDAGSHTLTWTYRKDSVYRRGSDAGWVDTVEFLETLPTQTLTVNAGNLPAGAAITVSPADRNGDANGTTPFARVYDYGTVVSLEAPLAAGASTFVGWTGCTSAVGRTCSVTLDRDLTVTAVFSSGGNLADAVDRPEWVFTSGGDSFWWSQTAVTHDGVDAAQAGAIGHSQSTRLETTQTLASSGYLAFWWKVSSEQGFDYLIFAVDGVERARISGEVDWERRVFPVSSGTHTLTWTYRKDFTVVRGSDTAWVDQVAFGTEAPAQTLTVESMNPPGGVPIAVIPPDRNGEGGGTTPFLRTYGFGQTVTLTAPSLEGENGFVGWRGCTSESGATCTVAMNGDRTVTAVFASGTDLGQAVDKPEWVFTSGGDASWFSQASVTHDGVDAAQSGLIGHGDVTWMKTTQTLATAGFLTFWWKVSSQEVFDVLEFSVDGTVVASISGEVDWERRIIPLQAGTRTLTWTYRKSLSGSQGADFGWVDTVDFSAEGPALGLRVDSANPVSGVAIAVSPPDRNGQAGGTTPFERTYGYGASVTLTAPAAAGGNTFTRWRGCTAVSGRVCTVTLEDERSVVAEYAAGATLAEAIDRPTWLIESRGDALWVGQSAVTRDGVDAAQSGSIGHSQSTLMETRREFTAGFFSFWWRVSSEPMYDRLEFLVDGVVQLRISGETEWERPVLSMSPGTHTLTWRYIKDRSITQGADAGWVDSVRFDTTRPPPVVKVASSEPSSGVPIAVSLADQRGERDGTTPFWREYALDSALELTAPATAGASGFVKWSGCNSVAVNVCSATLTADRVLTAVYAPDRGLGEAVDKPEWIFTSETPTGWSPQTAVTQDGVDAAQAGRVAHFQSTTMQTTQTLAARGFVFFSWKVSSELDYDFLEFSIDDVVKDAVSGETGWLPKVFEVPAGTHILRWTYRKDGSAVGGADTAWVDNVRFGREATMRTLTVASNLPVGVPVSVSPLDQNKRGGGTTRFTRNYLEGTLVTLEVPRVRGGNYFVRWTGCASVTREACTVAMASNQTVTAVYTAAVGLGAALEMPDWTFTSSPDNPWFGQRQASRDGEDAAQAGAVSSAHLATALETRRYFNGAGCFSFWWKVSGDKLDFAIDHQTKATISGVTDWKEEVFCFSGMAIHSFTWTYVKLSGTPPGENTAWVDNVRFAPTAPLPTLTVVSENAPGGATVSVVPADRDRASSGTTPFTRLYDVGASVTLTASNAAGGSGFMKWTGCDGAAGTECTVALSTSRIVTAVYAPGKSLGDAVEQPTWLFTSGGAAAWESQAEQTVDGVDAAQGGMIKNLQSSWMQTVRTFTSPGTLSFWWRVSSEPDFDRLSFLVDGIEQGAISGEVGWQQVNFPITPGTHFLRWNYGKDHPPTGGADAGWVDRISFASDVVYGVAVGASGPPSAVPIAVTPADRAGQSDGVTPFARSYGDMDEITLTAPAVVDDWAFSSWTGCDSVTGTSCSLTVNGEEAVTAVYRPAADLSVAPPEVALADGDPRGLGPASVRIVCSNAGPMPLADTPVRVELSLRRQEDGAIAPIGGFGTLVSLGAGQSVELPLPDPVDLLVPAWLGNGTWEPLVAIEPEDAGFVDPDPANNHAVGAATELAGLPAQIFADDFADGDPLGDGHWLVRTGTWRVNARERYANATQKSVSFVSRLDPWQSQPAIERIEADVRLPPRVDGAAAGIVFGGRWPNYRVVRLTAASISLAQVGRYGGRGAGTVASKKAAILPGRWYRLRVDVAPDGVVTAYLNGVLRLTGTLPEQVSGDVGVWAAKPGALFDNFSVSNEEALAPPGP